MPDKNIIEEIKHLIRKFKAQEILIVDDNFTFQPKRAMSLLKEVIKNRLNIKIQFSNGIRADIISPPLLKMMQNAGVYNICLGIESGNQDNINKLGKKGLRQRAFLN